MKAFSILRLIISAVIGLLIGVVITALINLFNPFQYIGWTIATVSLASLLSAVAGYLMGIGRRKDAEARPPQ